MQNLLEEYKESIKALKERVKKLNKTKLELQSITTLPDPKKDPNVVAIKRRIAPLRAMIIDLSAVEKEVKNYYLSNWWRSPKYTMNQSKGVDFVYSEPIYDD